MQSELYGYSALSLEQKRRMLSTIRSVKSQMPGLDLEKLCIEACELDASTFGFLMGVLNGPPRRRRKQVLVVLWILNRAVLTIEQRIAACAILGAMSPKWKLFRYTRWAAQPWVYGLMAASLVTMFGTLKESFVGILTAVIFGGVMAPLSAVDALRTRRLGDELMRTVCQMRVSQSVDILVARAAPGYSSWRDRSQLIEVLPCLCDGDYGAMQPQTLPRLLNMLEWNTERQVRDEEYLAWSTALLTAIGKIGDKSAHSLVQHISLLSGEPEETRELALHVLAILEGRDRKEEARKLLLRGSDIGEQENSLLRAANGAAGAIDAGVLMRATDGTIEE